MTATASPAVGTLNAWAMGTGASAALTVSAISPDSIRARVIWSLLFSSSMRRDERNRALGRKGAREDVGARVAVHVATDRHAEKIQNRRRDVDYRSALL